MLAIEVDGVSHNQEAVRAKDLEKEVFLKSMGITILRFQDDEIYPENRDALMEIERYVLGYEKRNGIERNSG